MNKVSSNTAVTRFVTGVAVAKQDAGTCRTEASPDGLTLIDRWQHQQRLTPSRIAVVTEHRQWTYAELNQLAVVFSQRLIQQGCRPGDRIGLCVDRSAEAIAAMLAVMQIGAAFVPLDPDYPPDRLAAMVQDASIQIIIGHRAHQGDLASQIWPSAGQHDQWIQCERVLSDLQTSWSPTLETEILPPLRPSADDLAYVMYTSGSTGRPKGVEISQRALVTYCDADIACYELTQDDRTLQFSTLCFDIAIEEIFPPLLSGGCVVVRPRGRMGDRNELSLLIDRFNITAIHLATAYWHSWVDLMLATGDRVPRSLRLVIATGEKVSVEHYRRWRQISDHPIRWCNAYGPTEATVSATVFIPDETFDQDAGNRNMPIGKPLPGYTACILDSDQHPVAVGESGELCIGGPALAIGYHKRPDLTRGAFIEVEIDGRRQRVYRTGDVARFLPDGNIDFGGRLDHQIKLGSFRIEPGEIEIAVNQYPGVSESLVTYDEQNQQKFLVAYVARGDNPVTASGLAEHLRGLLPAYMVPTRYVLVHSFPQTINGKIDRRALPSPMLGEVPRCDDYAGPRDDLERRLSEIWKEVLNLPKIGIHDDFFLLGGSSLLVTQVITRLTTGHSLELPVRDFFANPTIATSARQIRRLLSPTEHEAATTKENSPGDRSDAHVIRDRLPKVTAAFFQSGDQSLFSVRYRPSRTRPIGAVVMAHSIGQEYTRAYRNLQQLSVQLCRVGFEVLRFDYAGTGNSTGDGAKLTAEVMRRNLISAKQYAAKSSGIDQVAVVGLRLGATIAASLPPGTFDHTILWDPVTSGSDFLGMMESFHREELRGQTRYNTIRQADPRQDQLCGHAISVAKRESIQSLVLTRHPSHEVITTDDEIYWREHRFCEAAFSSPKSFAAIQAALLRTLDLAQNATEQCSGGNAVKHPTNQGPRAVLFGQHQNLVGVWTDAACESVERPRTESTAVLMLTAGMIHHSGPFGLHVSIADQLQTIGVASLRFDLSGIGESLAVGDGGSSLDRATHEVKQAIDWVQSQHGIQNVILFGLCSGADDAIHTAIDDRRVGGVIAMDGCGYRTRGYYFHRLHRHYLPRLAKADKWRGFFRRMMNKTQSPLRSLATGADIREFPSRKIAQRQLRELSDRSTQLHFVYTGGVGDYYNHHRQFDAMFPRLKSRRNVSHQFFGQMDHVGYLIEDRRKLVSHIVDTVQRMTTQF